MEHLLLKAVTTATDQGTFTAVISTASVDRDKDIIEPSAMVASLTKWAALGKLVPLAYNHTDEVIGHIDPVSVHVENNEVIAKGWIDQSIPRGQDVWRLVKSGTLSFSFGYLFDPANGATKLQGGGYRVKELDVFEISAIPIAPANNDTRVLGWKSLTEEAVTKELEDLKQRLATVEQELQEYKKADETDEEPDRARSVDPLRKQAESVALEFASDGLSLLKPPRKVEQPTREPELSLRDLKQRMRDEILSHLSGEPS
jgi:HK97 family phage prohead protease